MQPSGKPHAFADVLREFRREYPLHGGTSSVVATNRAGEVGTRGATALRRQRATSRRSVDSDHATGSAMPKGHCSPQALECRSRATRPPSQLQACLLYTSDAADEEDSVDL